MADESRVDAADRQSFDNIDEAAAERVDAEDDDGATVGGEPTLAFWRGGDLREALKAADDVGLALTCPRSVTDKILG